MFFFVCFICVFVFFFFLCFCLFDFALFAEIQIYFLSSNLPSWPIFNDVSVTKNTKQGIMMKQ